MEMTFGLAEERGSKVRSRGKVRGWAEGKMRGGKLREIMVGEVRETKNGEVGEIRKVEVMEIRLGLAKERGSEVKSQGEIRGWEEGKMRGGKLGEITVWDVRETKNVGVG